MYEWLIQVLKKIKTGEISRTSEIKERKDRVIAKDGMNCLDTCAFRCTVKDTICIKDT